MNPRGHPHPTPFLATLLFVALVFGCGRRGLMLAPNQPPTLELTSGPIDTSASKPVSWSVAIAWDARDADGTIDHVSYAVDPPSPRQLAAGAETVWVSTKANSVVVRFRATTLDSLAPVTTASDFHVFVARAWDNSGGASEPVLRAFYAYTVAPTARIEHPPADPFQAYPVPLSFNVEFSGDDPDGIGSREPSAFLLRLISDLSPMFNVLAADPDSLRREAAATGWRGWSTLAGDQTRFSLRDMPEGTRWVMALAAVDGAGAITPLFSFDRNLLQFVVSASYGPRLHVQGPGLDYTYADGSESTDSTRWLTVSQPVGTRATYSWSATAAARGTIAGYRWVLDPDTLEAETPRSDESNDIGHWSRWSPFTTFTGPLPPWAVGEHFLYIQAEDDLGGRSLGVVRVQTFNVGFERPLLVVDDTRLELDRLATGGCLASYTKPWPSASELDTLLYAVGGVPWRCAVNPPGALSPPGLLAGLNADTVGTRVSVTEMIGNVPLSLLTRYAHVLWITDFEGARGDGTLATLTLTMMRWMSRAQNLQPLEDYSRLGGHVWVVGGGAALASLLDFDQKSNNSSSNVVFAAGVDLSLRSFVASAGHLRSRIAATRSQPAINRSAAARGGWSGHGLDGALAAPDYTRLPGALLLKTPATDPLPPTRLDGQANLFYSGTTSIEYAHGSIVTEDFGAPGAPRVESALDTLLEAVGGTIQNAPAPAMLYYHGRDNGSVLFSGFDLWSWSRADTQALVDFVVHDVWRLAPAGPSVRVTRPSPAGALSSAARGARARPRSLDPIRPRP